MTVTKIKTGVIYDHEKYGNVLVTGIGKMYDEWSVDGPQDDIESGDVLVFFHDRYDGYGGMNPTPLSSPANEFAKHVDVMGEHEYADVDV